MCLGSREAVQERVGKFLAGLPSQWQYVLGQQGGGAADTFAGRQIPGRAAQPERRCETALPDGPAIKGRNTPSRFPPRFPVPSKCTSHLGFGLGATADTFALS